LGPTLESLHLVTPTAAALRHWPAVLLTAAVFGGVAGVGLRQIVRWSASLLYALALLALPLAAVTYFALQNFKPFNPRYTASGIAGYYLLLLAGWLALSRPWRRLAAAAVLALWAWSLADWYFVPEYGKEDYRAAVAWVAERIHPQDRLVAAGSPGLLDYYWRQRQPVYSAFWLGFVDWPERMRSRFSALVDSASTAYVLVTRPYGLDPSGRFETYLRRERGAVPVRFPGVRVYRLSMPGPAPEGAPPPGRALGPPLGGAGPSGASSARPMRGTARER
jgi:hypothetical protein